MAATNLVNDISLAFTQVGKDIKALRTTTGALTSLNADFTTASANTNLVAAINHAYATAKAASTSTSIINDSTKGTDKTYSSNKIESVIDTKVATAVSNVVDGAPATFDTLKEIATWIASREGAAATDVIKKIGKKVPYDEVITITDPQVQNVWTNIKLGTRDDSDFLTTYTTARDS